MSKSIKISPKHGLNPSIPICFWCQKEKNEIVLLGKMNEKDSEAPSRVFVNYKPCEECKKKIGNQIHVIGVESSPVYNYPQQLYDAVTKQKCILPPISSSEQGTFYPTGRWTTLTRDYFIEIKNNTEDEGLKKTMDSILKKGVVLFPDNELEQLPSLAESK